MAMTVALPQVEEGLQPPSSQSSAAVSTSDLSETGMDHAIDSVPPSMPLDRIASIVRNRRMSTATARSARTEFSTSSAINRGYSARIDVNGKVKPLQSSPKRDSCQTIAFHDGPDTQDKTYRPGDEIRGAVHLARTDPERGVVTGIKARIRGDLETSVFGVGDSSYYSMDNEHGIARRQLLFFSEQKVLCKKSQLDSGEFRLQQSGLVSHGGRRNNLAVPFSFVLPLKIQATALDLLDSKMKASYKAGKKYVDLPPSVDLETRYTAPRPIHLLDQVLEKVHGHRLRPMARIKYEIDIIVSRRRFGSDILPPKRGERIILSFNVEPYPPRTAAIAVPNMPHIRARRVSSSQSSPSADASVRQALTTVLSPRGRRGVPRQQRATSSTNATASGMPERQADIPDAEAAEEEEEPAEDDEDSWTQNLGGHQEPEEFFGALPRERLMPVSTRTRSRSTLRSERVTAAALLPRFRRSSTINVKEGVDGCLKGWLTHTVQTELTGDGSPGSHRGAVEAVLSVPATAAMYMETRIPFSLELRLPEGVGGGAEPTVELSLVRSVVTFSRLGTLVIEKETPDSLHGFAGPQSWSDRVRILDMTRQALPPYYEQGRQRQLWAGHFVINRHERMIRAGSGTHRSVQVTELSHVIPSFAFKALRVEYRVHVRVLFPDIAPLVLETPPVTVAASPAQPEAEEAEAAASARASSDDSQLPALDAALDNDPETSEGEEDLLATPDEADAELLSEQIALGLVSRQEVAAVQRAQSFLPSYGESIGPFG